MQQTEKYKLNLIETSDAFSPNPLNENAQKVEAQFSAEAAARAAGEAALDQRVTVLEGHKIATGTYNGTGAGSITISLGFTPIAVIGFPFSNVPYMAVTDTPVANIKIVDGGFTVTSDLNRNGTYNFIAFL